ncbi:MAG: alpha/beta fold hydrolase [Ilumatobacteraceae bacterium]
MTSRPAPAILPGAEAWAHHAAPGTDGPVTIGVLVLHGFTGNPSSMRGFAEAMAGAGFHVELPRLPGHGTTVEDMITTGWADWSAEVEAAYGRLAGRVERIVVAGLSMGGALTLWLGLAHPEVVGLVCVNPATRAQPADVRSFLADTLAAGTAVMPGIGSDIADPEASESAYEGMPLGPLLSLIDEGLAAVQDRYGELAMPLLLFTSREDHVVPPADSEYLVEHYGGPVDHRWLERSYHVATLDFDRDLIFLDAADFTHRVAAS